ncbi:branched-chain alpha-keto acid dehydrogenase subunit E2 [Azospirillum sp. TSH7]|uniref:dihydrolipoamide acetyltransferase family protein n=1 Tax=unclassified Azospirillum TaxID=2630922 RepID=UPI000D607101|nr:MULTISPECIES: dihydrolipoamide acetyltransferase family protein [unclassified Azospirillum]PWC55442.1 branched-chain alpha-keto acid dehydrogenase subunit E2 [Azospirillum sp. TSH20]PWC56765.1 branched-chain alpha-keto acid dehydrogenase subunit E2 [Azospirillum sp. TSH7]
MGIFRMPSLGADMEAGVLVEWLKQPGDAVARGDIVAVVETQKGAIEVETFEAGVIERLLVTPGTTVPVGTPLALLAGAGESIVLPSPEPQPSAPPPPPLRAPAPLPSPPVTPPPVMVATAHPPASPAARRLATDRGIALTAIAGSGPGGAVLLADVERAAATPSAAPQARGSDLAQMRRAIAAAMARSNQEIPHYYLSTTVALAKAHAWLSDRNTGRPPEQRLLLAALQLKAVALALRRLPEFNGFCIDGTFRPAEGIHIGTAVAIRGGGLVAPAIHDTDKLAVDEVMARLRDVVARARSGRLRSSELQDPTITVTSLGDRGIEGVFGVIYPPQVAIVGFGKPVERPWVVDGQVVPCPVMTATLAADHRVSDGHRGALLLAEIDRLLQEPGSL